MTATTNAQTPSVSQIWMTTMTLEEFLAIPNYENNRDVEGRVKRKAHLRGATTLSQLVCAVCHYVDKSGENKVCKIDSHGRSLAWESGVKDRPTHVQVIHYKVDSEKERYELYQTIDSSDAVETTKEKTKTALLEESVDMVSSLGKSAWASAVKIASGKKNEGEAVAEYSAELYLIDCLGIDVTKGRTKLYPTGIKIAMLDTFKENADKAMNFWINYDLQTGSYVEEMNACVANAGLGSSAQAMLSGKIKKIFADQ